MTAAAEWCAWPRCLMRRIFEFNPLKLGGRQAELPTQNIGITRTKATSAKSQRRVTRTPGAAWSFSSRDSSTARTADWRRSKELPALRERSRMMEGL
jgi:hypothetical protein